MVHEVMGKKKKPTWENMNRPKDNYSIAIGLLPILTQEFEKAKANKDHAVSSKLRKQVWVVTDFAHGVKPDIPDDELREILKDLPLHMPGEEPGNASRASGAIPASNSSQNRLNKLRARLDQISKLKEKQAKGEPLEKNQVEKILSEDEVKKQIEELETLMASCS